MLTLSEVGFPAVFHRDDVDQRGLHGEADALLQDEKDLHCREILRFVEDATQRHGCWHTDRAASKTDALLHLQVSALCTLMRNLVSVLGSSLNGAAASDKKHTFVTHLFKSKQLEIAVMPPEQFALEVLMEKSLRCTAEVHARA